MLSRYFLLGISALLAGCSSPGSFIQDTSQSLAKITASLATYDTFKTTIATNASYARLAYADTLASAAIINGKLPKQVTGDVCLNYSIAKNVQDADIQKRVKALQSSLTKATNILCTGSQNPNNLVSTGAPANGNKTTDTSSASSCPVTKDQAAVTSFSNFINSFSAVAGLTPLSAYATAADSAAQLGIQLYLYIGQQRDYQLTVAFLRAPKTQVDFKYAVERLESDLKNANDDLEANMHTWRECDTARLSLAHAKLNWNDGASTLIFSREAVDSKKMFDVARIQYLDYKKSFISNETSSLSQLETAFSKLPYLSGDLSSVDPVVKALGTVQTNVQKLEAAGPTPSKLKVAAAQGRTSPVFALQQNEQKEGQISFSSDQPPLHLALAWNP